MNIFRKIILYIQRFFAFIFMISFFVLLSDWDIGLAIFIFIIIIIVDWYDFQLIKNKIVKLFNNNNNETVIKYKDDIEKQEPVEENNKQEDVIDYWEYSSDNYKVLTCETWETLNTEINYDFHNKWEQEREKIYNKYWELSIEHEEIKQFWDYTKMIDYESKIHLYFSDEVLENILKMWFIDSTEPINDKLNYDEWYINTFEFIWKKIEKEKFEKIKLSFENRNKYFKNWVNNYIYDLYAKSLRRIGNYYKKKKLWEESLNIFTIIEDMWQAGVMDKKSIIKIKKELSK